MRCFIPTIALLLVYLLTPGAFELTENVLHLVGHGDTAHGDADHSEAEPSDEHGCSGPYHFCLCHHSNTFLSGAVLTHVIAKATSTAYVLRDAPEAIDSGFVERVYRPPRG